MKQIIKALKRVVHVARHFLAAGLGAIGGVLLGWVCMIGVALLKLALHLPTPPPPEIDIGRSPIFWGSVVFSSVYAVFEFRKDKLGIPFAEDYRRFAAWVRREKPQQGELPFDR